VVVVVVVVEGAERVVYRIIFPFCFTYCSYHKWLLVISLAPPQTADGVVGLQIRKVTANILKNVSVRADRGWSSSLGVGLVGKIFQS
jgi:hypothetical protein